MEIDEKKLRLLMEPVTVVLGYDLEKLRHENEVKRASLWNQIKSAETLLERQYYPELTLEERADKAREITLARLLLAAAAYINGEKNPIIQHFSEAELTLINTFERNNLFDILSVDELADRMARRKNIYDLAMEFNNSEYARLDRLLESPEVQKSLKIAFNQRYRDRMDRVIQGVQAYIDKYGAGSYVGQVKEAIEKNRTESITETNSLDNSDKEE